jgi:hypothetical protein
VKKIPGIEATLTDCSAAKEERRLQLIEKAKKEARK